MASDDSNLEEITQLALDEFWSVVADAFPDAKSGDLSVERTFQLDKAAQEAVQEWVRNNATHTGPQKRRA